MMLMTWKGNFNFTGCHQGCRDFVSDKEQKIFVQLPLSLLTGKILHRKSLFFFFKKKKNLTSCFTRNFTRAAAKPAGNWLQ
jgi:hypothetical protein